MFKKKIKMKINFRFVLGSFFGVMVMLIGIGYIAAVVQPTLKEKLPWAWFAGRGRADLYVCKQDSNPNFYCKKDLVKPIDADDNKVNVGESLDYRIDFDMPSAN